MELRGSIRLVVAAFAGEQADLAWEASGEKPKKHGQIPRSRDDGLDSRYDNMDLGSSARQAPTIVVFGQANRARVGDDKVGTGNPDPRFEEALQFE